MIAPRIAAALTREQGNYQPCVVCGEATVERVIFSPHNPERFALGWTFYVVPMCDGCGVDAAPEAAILRRLMPPC